MIDHDEHRAKRAARAGVVVAEDDPDMRHLVVRALGKDHEVEAVEDGAALLSRLGRAPTPGLVVTDLRMPWLDGLEALRKLRVTPLPRGPPS